MSRVKIFWTLFLTSILGVLSLLAVSALWYYDFHTAELQKLKRQKITSIESSISKEINRQLLKLREVLDKTPKLSYLLSSREEGYRAKAEEIVQKLATSKLSPKPTAVAVIAEGTVLSAGEKDKKLSQKLEKIFKNSKGAEFRIERGEAGYYGLFHLPIYYYQTFKKKIPKNVIKFRNIELNCEPPRMPVCNQKCLKKEGDKCLKRATFFFCSCRRVKGEEQTSEEPAPQPPADKPVASAIFVFKLSEFLPKGEQYAILKGGELVFFSNFKKSEISEAIELVQKGGKAKSADLMGKFEAVYSSIQKNSSLAAVKSKLLPQFTIVSKVSLASENQKLLLFFAQSLAVGFAVIVLSMLFLFGGAAKVQRAVSDIEDKISDSISYGKFDVEFDERAPKPISSLAYTLNQFYQLLQNSIERAKEMAAKAQEIIDTKGQSLEAELREKVAAQVKAEAAAQSPPPSETTTARETGDDEEAALSPEWIEEVLRNPEKHYLEVFQRYVEAKRELGEDVSRLREERFIQKLRNNAEKFVRDYDCRGVIFDVLIKDNKVILKPQLIPKEE